MQTENHYTETDLGNISPNPKGDYENTAKYEYLDLVAFQQGSYLCLAKLGQTITGVAPEPGKTTEHWQCVAMPGGMTPQYTDAHDKVVRLAKEVQKNTEQVATDKQSVTQMAKDTAQLKAQAEESAKQAESSKDSAAGYARGAEEAAQRVGQSEKNVRVLVNGFDAHVGSKIQEAEQAVQGAQTNAIQAIERQEASSVQEVKNQTGAYITEQKETAKQELEQKVNQFNLDVDAIKKQVADEGAKQVKSVQDASTTETTKITKKGTEQTGIVAEEGTKQVQAVQAAAQEIIADREQIETNKADIEVNKSSIIDLRVNLGLVKDGILGLQADYKNKSFKRLGDAVGLTPGEKFNKYTMYGGRRRCNVADDGTIKAWYGDVGYKEDGSNGQVMVYQPKFYYAVVPLEYDKQETGYGYHLRKANYYVSETQMAGFKLHPAFYDKNGSEVDYILMSAYEGCIHETAVNTYILNDEQVMDASKDKFSSIAGARPASGSSQNLTRPNIEQMAKNRGVGWHLDNIKIVSMNQLIMMIEMGQMELQTAIGKGVAEVNDIPNTENNSVLTGGTSSLGNKTGMADGVNGKVSIAYRGLENPWGNIWKLVYGVNIWGNGKMDGGQPYICKDFNYSESKNTDNYIGAGFTVVNKSGYISAMGYSPSCDWLFMASECLGNSSLPVGDYTYTTGNLNSYRIALLGGYWRNWSNEGGFCWHLGNGAGARNRDIGGRLVYVPTHDSVEYIAAIASWKEQMKKGVTT